MKRGADTKSLQSFDTFFDFIPVRIYKPTSMKSDSALFYIHGGGWVLDNLDTYDELVRYMAQELEIFVVSVE
jgi:acetyl esterase